MVVSEVDFLSGERDLGFGLGAWKAGSGFWAMRRSNSGAEVLGEVEKIDWGVMVVGFVRGGMGDGGFGGGRVRDRSFGREGSLATLGGDSSGDVELGDGALGGGCTFAGGAIGVGGFGEGSFGGRTTGEAGREGEVIGGNPFSSGALANASFVCDACGNCADSESDSGAIGLVLGKGT